MDFLGSLIKGIKGVVMAVIDLCRLIKFKQGDAGESAILEIISKTIDGVADKVSGN